MKIVYLNFVFKYKFANLITVRELPDGGILSVPNEGTQRKGTRRMCRI